MPDALAVQQGVVARRGGVAGVPGFALQVQQRGGRENAKVFSHHQYGAPLMQSPERTGGRYCLYRFHGDNPVTFTRYLKHTMEHGHANDRADCFYSCCYWYQDKVSADFPALPDVKDRIPKVIPA